MNAALELQRVTRRFGATPVLRGVDLTVAEGERHALIGPNGAGKSTLFDLIAGRTPPTSGRILLDGRDVTGEPSHRMSRLGLARSFQTTSVFPALSVLDNLRCALIASKRGGRWHRSPGVDHEAARLLDALGLASRRDRLAATLAYAEQRALDLGIALATGAPVLLLDEPTAGMNREESRLALDLIRATTAGKTVLIVEHDMDAVFGFADRISVLVSGRVIATDTPDAIRRHPAVREAYLGDTP
jgi:branched-chain amino acid transport system ATP-binding protein